MSVIAVIGDCATTTSVALASTWPDTDIVVLEADRRGGSLAGWLDTPANPSLATIVANSAGGGRGLDAVIESMTHRSASGVRFIANAVRARPAHRAVDEAATNVLPMLAAAPRAFIADLGAHRSGEPISPVLRFAASVVLVHRQATASAAAATVRIERLVESVEELAHIDAPLLLAIIGTDPFDPAEIGHFVDQSVPGAITGTVVLADDSLSAATIAGRSGVSAKRLARLPLIRDAAALGDRIRSNQPRVMS